MTTYVGKIFNAVSSALDLNAATLTGAMDIIVVQHEDGTLKSSPFHVRFGKLRLLRSREKVVSVHVNGEPTSLTLTLGSAGEAYFVEATDDPPPADLCPSPMLSPMKQGSNLETMASLSLADDPDPPPFSDSPLGKQDSDQSMVSSSNRNTEDNNKSNEDQNGKLTAPSAFYQVLAQAYPPSSQSSNDNASSDSIKRCRKESFKKRVSSSSSLFHEGSNSEAPQKSKQTRDEPIPLSDTAASKPTSYTSDSEINIHHLKTLSRLRSSRGLSRGQTSDEPDDFDYDLNYMPERNEGEVEADDEADQTQWSSSREKKDGVRVEGQPFPAAETQAEEKAKVRNQIMYLPVPNGTLREAIAIVPEEGNEKSPRRASESSVPRRLELTPPSPPSPPSPPVPISSVLNTSSRSVGKASNDENDDPGDSQVKKRLARKFSVASELTAAYTTQVVLRPNGSLVDLQQQQQQQQQDDHYLVNGTLQVQKERRVSNQDSASPRAASATNHAGESESDDTDSEEQNLLGLSVCRHLLREDMDEDTVHAIFEENRVSYAEFAMDPLGMIFRNPNLLFRIQNRLVDWKVAAPMIVSMLAFNAPLDVDRVEMAVRNWEREEAEARARDEQQQKKGGFSWFGLRRRGAAAAATTTTTATASTQSMGSAVSHDDRKYMDSYEHPLLLNDYGFETVDNGKKVTTSAVIAPQSSSQFKTTEDGNALSGSYSQGKKSVSSLKNETNASTASFGRSASSAVPVALSLGSVPPPSRNLVSPRNEVPGLKPPPLSHEDTEPLSIKPGIKSESYAPCKTQNKSMVSDLDTLRKVETDPTLKPDLQKAMVTLSPQPDRKYVRKSLVPSEEVLKSLKLKPGVNTVMFTVLYNGQTVSAQIFLWRSSDVVVISDVDGTITRSDVLGHLLPRVGKDWSHEGVASLYMKIRQRGFNMLYLTSRPIGQACSTRLYLQTIEQTGGARLPEGPVIMSPDRLVASFTREVIRRRPDEFKIMALQQIRDLFPSEHNPFYAGFGNRETDEKSYRSVGIRIERIFTVNPKGQLAVLHSHYEVSSSYSSLKEFLDDVFPDLAWLRGSTTAQQICASAEYNDINFWKPNNPLEDIDIDALLEA